MALSDYEKEVLAELEAEFSADSSREAASTQKVVREFEKKAESRPSAVFSVRHIALGALLALAGLVGLIVAVSLGYRPLSVVTGVVSFAVIVAGCYCALHRSAPEDGRSASRSVGCSASKQSRLGNFMDAQRRRWDERER